MSEINVTPLVDVMLVLLIVFMVAAPLMTAGIPIELPQSGAKQLDSQTEPLVVSVDAKNLVYLGDNQKSLDQLESELQANTDKEKQIYVRADTKVNYGQVMAIMDILNHTGFKKIGLVTGVDASKSGGLADQPTEQGATTP